MNRTRHYKLPLFEGTDKPSILTDWNETVQKIDTALFTIASGGDSELVDTITALQESVTALNLITDDLQTQIDTVNASFANTFNDETQYEKGDYVIFQTSLYKYVDPIPSAGSWDGTKWALTQVTDVLKDISDIISENTSDISDIKSDMSGLDTRVTALENAPASSGGVSLSDMATMSDSDAYFSSVIAGSSTGFTSTSLNLANTSLRDMGEGYITIQPDIAFEFNSLPTQAKNKTIRTLFYINVSDDRGGNYRFGDRMYIQEATSYFCKGTEYSGTFQLPIKIDPQHTSLKIMVYLQYFDTTSERYWYAFDATSATIYNNSVTVYFKGI